MPPPLASSEPRDEPPLRDLGVRLAGVPVFGIVIPDLTGLFGSIGPSSILYWCGYLWFVLLSGLVWQGNRLFLLRVRRRYDWFEHRWRRIGWLLVANVLYTAPLSVLMLVAWYRMAGVAAVDWGAVRLAAVVTVAVVIFVTHVYEVVHFIQARERDVVAVAHMDRARAVAQLDALKTQIDPHFLFNCLNSLAHLIPRDTARAVEFTARLSEVYRYILLNRQADLVPLEDELAFAEGYVGLLRLRFGDAIALCREGLDEPGSWRVPPVSLQVLLENAVKHNAIGPDAPLEIRVVRDGDRIAVSNATRAAARTGARRSSPLGLANLDERCRGITGRGVEVRTGSGAFTVLLPLVSAAA